MWGGAVALTCMSNASVATSTCSLAPIMSLRHTDERAPQAGNAGDGAANTDPLASGFMKSCVRIKGSRQ